jgi:two-component system sensor histidine kinase CpxA
MRMKLKARSLFIKIFLWFWLVTALTGIVLFVVAVMGGSARNREVQQERAEERRRQMAQTLAFYGETAVKLVAIEGPQALDAYSDQLARTVGIHPFFFLQPDRPRPNVDVPPEVLELARRAQQSGRTEYMTRRDEFVLAQPLQSSSGDPYIVVGKTHLDPTGGAYPAPREAAPVAQDACRGQRPGDDCSYPSPHGMEHGKCQATADVPLACIPNRPPPEDILPQAPDGPPAPPSAQPQMIETGFIAQISGNLDRYSRDLGKYLVITFVIGGLACYLLTWHLTAPLRRLRMVAQELADGDFSARAGRDLSRRGDEIADLGSDIDRMAERIEGLIDSQRRLLRDISHELRSPLARLNVALELARQSAGTGASSSLDRIERESNRLNELIGQLLTLTQLEGDSDRIAREEVDLAALLAEIARDVDFEARNCGRSVEIVACAPVRITGSQELLRRAIENIVRNAIRYTKEGTAVELSLAADIRPGGTWAIVGVRDHGIGVPDSELLNIFRPFYRVSDGRERESGGVGIGLAITERAVRMHGGSVHAFNAKDGGLSVQVELPLVY